MIAPTTCDHAAYFLLLDGKEETMTAHLISFALVLLIAIAVSEVLS